VHPKPSAARSDGSSMVALKDFEAILAEVMQHDGVTRGAAR
jgi:3-deoxy-D-manno-octulosonic acid (KDO) 8-phosphate synthase